MGFDRFRRRELSHYLAVRWRGRFAARGHRAASIEVIVRHINPQGSNRRRMNLSCGQLDQIRLGKTMISDDKKIKTHPANKNDVPSKDKSTAVDTSKAEGGKIADAVPYSRGEGQKPVSQAYRDNWNAIFARKKKR
jgi:hypothetical protein